MSIENLKTSHDPFADADDGPTSSDKKPQQVHVRIQQRNGRKSLTTCYGLSAKFDMKKVVKELKKKFACNGSIVNDPEVGPVIQLQGDQRKVIFEFLTDKNDGLGLDKESIVVHGF